MIFIVVTWLTTFWMLFIVRFAQKKMYKFQSYAEILNQQRGSEVFLQDRRTWLTNVY